MHRLARKIFQASCLIACFPAHAEEIDEILVTAVRHAVVEDQLSLSLSEIGADEIGRHALLTDALANASGVHLQQTTPGQGTAIIRGQRGSAVLHLVDGMRLNNAIFRSAPTQYFSLVPSSAVERIEVLRGTPASVYGSDAIGGVVQVVTTVPAFESSDLDTRGEVFASANTAERGRVIGGTVDAGTNRLATSVSVEYADIGDRRIGGGERIEPSGYTSQAARFIVSGTPDDRRAWSVDFHDYKQPKTPRVDELVPGFGQTEPSSSEFWFRPNRRSFVHGDYHSADGLLGLDWNVDLAWQRIDDDRQTRDYLAPDRTFETNRSDLYGLTVSGSKLTVKGSWIAGVDFYRDEVSSSRVSEDIASGQRTEATPRFPDGSTMQLLSAYGNRTWSVGRHALTAGLRLSDVRTHLPSSQVDNTEVSGDAGWVADINVAWQFTSNIGFGFRAPNVFDLGTLGNRPGNRFNIPNTGLESEHVVHGDVGVRFKNALTEFELSAYAMRYRDRITSVLTGDTTPDGRDITQSVNAARSHVVGIEASVSASLGTRWAVNANLSWTRGEQTLPGAGSEPADRIPPLSGFVSLQFASSPALDFELWAAMSAAQDRLSSRDIGDSRIDPAGTPGWVNAGARGAWRPSDRWELSVQLSNVLDKRYRVHGSGIDAAGRNVSVAVRRRWQ